MSKMGFYKFIEHERHNRWGDDYVFMEEKGKAVGRVYVYYSEKEVAYIEGLHVTENERIKTIGSELLKKLIDKCEQLGAKECMLWCYKDDWVYYWYQNMGFEYYGEHQEEGAIWMIKYLHKKI